MVKVTFQVTESSAVAETLPRRINSDGSVEWTEPIELRVDDSRVLLIAVVTQMQKGLWRIVEEGKIKGPTVDFMKSDVWQRSSTSPVSPSFYAKAEVHMDDVPQGDIGLPRSAPTAPVSDHVGVDASSDSHDSLTMRRGTSVFSTRFETARDWLPSGMQRAQSEGNDMGATRAQSGIPTVAAVPVDPLGIQSLPIIPHTLPVRTNRGSLTAGYSEPQEELSMRRTPSGGFIRQGSGRGYTREGSGRSRWSSFGSRSSHTDDSLIREESSAQSVNINSLTSPVGKYPKPRLLDERVPLLEDTGRAEESLVSSEDLIRSWGGRALASEIGGTKEEVKTESRPPPFVPEVDSPPRIVPQTPIDGESQPKERRPSGFFHFFGKPKKGPLATGGMGPQSRSECTDGVSGRVEKMTGKLRRRLSAVSIEEEMTPTKPTEGLERPGRVLHPMPLQETRAQDEPLALSPVGEADTGIVDSDGENTDSVALEEVTESKQVGLTMIRADAKAEMETEDEAGKSPEQKMQKYEYICLPRRKPLLPASPPNNLADKTFMSPLRSPPDTDVSVEEDSPPKPTPSAPPLSPMIPRLTNAEVEVGPCSPVSHDEEEKDDGYVDEDSTRPFPVWRLEIPSSRQPGYTRVTGGYLNSLVGVDAYPVSKYSRNLSHGVMQPNPSIQSTVPDPNRAVGVDRVIFDCFAPRTVVRDTSFELVMFAYLRQQREEVLRDAQRRDAVEAGMPKIIPIMLNKRVTVVLVSRMFIVDSRA